MFVVIIIITTNISHQFVIISKHVNENNIYYNKHLASILIRNFEFTKNINAKYLIIKNNVKKKKMNFKKT